VKAMLAVGGLVAAVVLAPLAALVASGGIAGAALSPLGFLFGVRPNFGSPVNLGGTRPPAAVVRLDKATGTALASSTPEPTWTLACTSLPPLLLLSPVELRFAGCVQLTAAANISSTRTRMVPVGSARGVAGACLPPFTFSSRGDLRPLGVHIRNLTPPGCSRGSTTAVSYLRHDPSAGGSATESRVRG